MTDVDIFFDRLLVTDVDRLLVTDVDIFFDRLLVTCVESRGHAGV